MYQKLFQKVLFPFYEDFLRGRNTLKYTKVLNENQWKSIDELKSLQWERLKKLLEHAYAQSPYYQRMFKSMDMVPDDIQNYSDFQNIPICSRDDVVKYKEEMVAKSYRKKLIEKSTGGSTGVPVQFALDRDSHEWRFAAAQRGYQWATCEVGQHTLHIWGVDVGNPGRMRKLKLNMYHKFFNRKMFNCFDFTESEMLRCRDYINTKRPTGIVSFTSAIYNFAEFLSLNNLYVKPVQSIIIGAEKLFDYQRELIEKVFQCRVFNTYGCREFMLIAAECDRHEGLHVTVDNLFVEILNDGKPAQAGESGEVVVTDLHNFGMPFIRYKNGDIAIQGDRPCSCGRGLPLITDIEGREMDMLTATNGKKVTGGFFPHLMKEFVEVRKYQVIQNAKDKLTVRLVLNCPISPEKMAFCRNEIGKVMGEDMTIDFKIVDDIPLTLTGKYRTTISEIAIR